MLWKPRTSVDVQLENHLFCHIYIVLNSYVIVMVKQLQKKPDKNSW